MTRAVFAHRAGIEYSLLANIEHARSPTRWGVIEKIAKAHQISLRYLAEGNGAMFRPSAFWPVSEEFTADPQAWFSTIYDRDLRVMIATMDLAFDLVDKSGGKAPRPVPLAGMPLWEFELITVESKARQLMRKLSDKENVEFYKTLHRTIDNFANALKSRATSQKEDLTDGLNSLTTGPVQPVLPKLIDRIREATKERGGKAALAAWLGVHRHCVTDWLKGKQKPNGETTLRLLQWVEAEERKQQSPGDAMIHRRGEDPTQKTPQ